MIPFRQRLMFSNQIYGIFVQQKWDFANLIMDSTTMFPIYRISAHRIVLSASSAYFSAMFTGSLREAQQSEITLGDVHGDALHLLVQYCYTGLLFSLLNSHS